ncbi:MAG: hypothetical protein OXL39_00620 [Caldilineaceae bacterium]|nr:hypothetical protein [Caldilineaceae bacterium]
MNFGAVQDLLSEVGAQVFGCSQVDFASGEEFRQFFLHTGDAQQSGDAVGLELNEQVDIAVGPEIFA